ncbi:MAG: efflux RND transporter periplasmic adaptor subunit [Planctomycetota bacterium]|jgi:multidrug efflux pump subunit AcrA (membrane-fusion protein)
MSRTLALILLAAWVVHAQGMPPTPVETATVERREIVAERSFVGTLEAVRASTVGGELEGLVVEYLVREGDRVEKGQVLAKLRTKLIEARVAAAKAQLELRRQELAELENGARPDELEEARARTAQAKAELEYREWKVLSARRLFDASTISEDEVKDASFAALSAQEKLKEAQASFRLVEAGPRKERIAQAKARMEAQQAEVKRLEDDLDRHTLRAPFSGYVVREHTEVGEWLAKGAPVAELVALDEVDVTVPVMEDYVHGLKRGMEVPVTVDAFKDRTFPGKLVAIVPRADARARTFPVRIRVANVQEGGTVLLKSGMFARIRLNVGEKMDAIVVPKDALVLGGPSPMVYVVDPKSSTVRPVPVATGVAVDDFIQVLGPLAPGDKVVTRGNERLRPGQSVALPTKGR